MEWLNVSRSKDNQTMKFVQLIEDDMKNIFLEKSIPRPFSKKFKFGNSGSLV